MERVYWLICEPIRDGGCLSSQVSLKTVECSCCGVKKVPFLKVP